MDIVICMLRGVNVGGHAKIKMEALRTLFLALGLHNPRTLVQSGNVVFGTQERTLSRLAHLIENGIEREFGFRPSAILRTPAEMKAVIDRNPFAKRHGVDPTKLLVTFLAADPTQEAREQVLKMKIEPEELLFSGRELYIHYPNGVGRSRLAVATIFKILKTSGTARNWNTVTKLLELAEVI
jgi:uncharacterized protein (DUF1697 family)